MSLQLWNSCQKAAAYFDDKYPGWWKEVNLDDFNMSNPFTCMLGQTNCNPPNYLDSSVRDEDVFAIHHPNNPDYCKKLKKYWTTLINQRKYDN